MIDTVKSVLMGGYRITRYELFKNFYEGYLRGFFEPPYTPYTGRNRLYSWSLPINDGRYRPRLIILKSRYTRGYPYLYIEFSIPKLLFGNNLYEIREQDFSAVVNKLLIVLEEMSVLTTADVIINAPVQKIHYSKNFILPEALL